MVLQLAYVIRKPDVDFDPNVAYAGIRTAFSIRVHYGGSFTQALGRRYINGYSKIVDELDSDEFSLHELDAIVEELGNDGHKIMFYHFMKPDGDLDCGLQPLGSDQDVLFLSKYVEDGHKFVDIYVEHEKTNPNLYFTSPTNWNMALNQQSAGLPEEWVHPCYRLETWKKAYSYHIKPIRGPLHWPKCNVPTTLLPPTHQPQIGRPRKQRRKSRAEVDVVHMSKNGKLTWRLNTVTCEKCGTRGHNSRSCTGPRKSQSKGVGKKMKERSSAGADKGKGVAVDDGKKKKVQPRKKVIVLG